MSIQKLEVYLLHHLFLTESVFFQEQAPSWRSFCSVLPGSCHGIFSHQVPLHSQLLRLLFLIEYKGDLRPSSNYNSCYHTDASSDSREAQDRETSVSSENNQVHDTEEKQEEVV